MLKQLDTSLDRIVVTEIRDHVFYAELHLVTSGHPHVVSCRPSGAIAVAVRTRSPIFATEGSCSRPVSTRSRSPTRPTTRRSSTSSATFLDDLDPDDFKGE
ncbi:MAG: DUF151 domain-containing protein [Ilumatobacteraceae bacterium]